MGDKGEKQVPRCARNDRKKGKDKDKSKQQVLRCAQDDKLLIGDGEGKDGDVVFLAEAYGSGGYFLGGSEG